jgi:hypothetical protein
MPPRLVRRLPIGECVRRYEAGASLAQIAAAAGVTRQSMWDSLRRVVGLQMRPRERYGAENHFFRGGGRKVEADGRVRVYVRGRWYSEHRVVLAQVLGRPLRPDEDVRWKNGVKGDNRPENLEVLPHGEHSRQVHSGRRRRPESITRRMATMAARYGAGIPAGWWRELRWLARQPVVVRRAYLARADRHGVEIPAAYRARFDALAARATREAS